MAAPDELPAMDSANAADSGTAATQRQPTEESAQPTSTDSGTVAAGDKGAGRGRGKGRGNKGKSDFNRQRLDKRKNNDNSSKSGDWRDFKRRKVNKQGEVVENDRKKDNPFSKEEIEAEQRRPKRKVAVMIGYAGTGYKGMQLNGDEPTIERELFRAFVAAGAISKANADDPKKSSLSRCARTDKGVHAAGNVISLKLITEDEDVLDKINDTLPPQIRVWGIQRTNNSYNCYQMCDSRWYEYLLPSYSLLPPHPRTFLAKKLVELSKEYGGEEDFAEAMSDVKGFWENVDEKEIKPILERLDPEVRAAVLEQVHVAEPEPENQGQVSNMASAEEEAGQDADAWVMVDKEDALDEASKGQVEEAEAEESNAQADGTGVVLETVESKTRVLGPFDYALRDIKAAYITAKRRYRITPKRLQRLQAALDEYLGTRNFHNYTVQKTATDPSAMRHMKSFKVNPTPIIIGDTEWLSLKVHGQSFMMHQIRKMVGLASLTVRCGTPLARIGQTYGAQKMAIPKAPGLGLLLERPVFDNYNRRAEEQFQKETIDFSKYEEKLEAFKHKEIYTRIFEVEEKEHTFHQFFNQIDQFKSNHFLWVTAGGLSVAKLAGETAGQKAVDKELGDEDEDPEGGEG